jgi:hypothetical protein
MDAQSIQLLRPSGEPLAEDDFGFVFGHGDTLHFILDRDWMSVELSNL